MVRNAGCRLGWQVQHEFSVTQAASSQSALEALGRYFQCGRIIENTRRDNHREPLLRYSVRSRQDLVTRIIPFFEDNPLITAKQQDFLSFCQVIDSMQEGRHLEHGGLVEIARITETMNRKQQSRFLESSEAIRQPSPSDGRR